MRSLGVVVSSPNLDHDTRIGTIAEPFKAQALITEFPVEALAGAVLPGLSGVYVRGADVSLREPVQH